MKTLKSLWFILLLTLFFSTGLYAQNEANFWYFGHYCGLDFNSGIPVVLYDGHTSPAGGYATISDSTGNLLFYVDASRVYNKHHVIMLNGNDLVHFSAGLYGRAIVKWPGQDGIYYIFTAVHPNYTGFYYAVVDMKLDNGLGAVTQKEIQVESAIDAADIEAIVKKENSENVWVIVRKWYDDAYAVYLIDGNGFNPIPVLSEMPDQKVNEGGINILKISYDKKYLISVCSMTELEVCRFNASNGLIEYMYTLEHPGGDNGSIVGMEFSPDSKYLYVSFDNYLDTNRIYQFDMQYIADNAMFSNSGISVGSGSESGMGLQLARDGRIYNAISNGNDPEYYLGVINNPWIRGEGCMYENNVLNMYPNKVNWTFPNILVDYLLRFEWEGDQCQDYPIKFIPNFIPTPDSIKWNFGEFAPGSVSFELSPVYDFQNAGIHEVEVDVWYPSGRYEHTSREIEILPSPQPELGPDTLICDGSTITINANCDADFFSWSTGQFGVSSITVSDSGSYWVRGRFNNTGCASFDTIHVGFHPPTIIDETNLIITPTTCNGETGSITGLTALGPSPFAFHWLDLSGNDYGTNIDATNLPAGQYQLTITDGNGCETVSEVYTIEDAGDLQVTQAQTTRPHCFKDDGQIVVHAFSPSGSILEYSIDAGVNYQYDSVFSGLFAMSYAVQVRDENGCSGFYLDNPVVLEDIPGPQLQPPVVTDETDFLGNGSIEIVASGSTPVIYYSIDSGATWQLNDGNFYNLQSRVYNLQIKDENGCDTSFTVEIQNIILTYLHAVTGEDGLCEDSAALIPVTVDNFNSVANFHLKLGYNADNLQCEGFINVHPLLLDSLTGLVDQAAGDIHLTWKSTPSVTFTGTEKVADLVFTTKNSGQGQLSWYTGTTESYFTNAGGNLVPAVFQAGEVEIYAPPVIFNTGLEETACIGQIVSLTRFADGNQPPFDYLWTYPDGHQDDSDPFFFGVTQTDSGEYYLIVTDHVGCSDQQVIQLIVSENPVAAFHGTDTLEMYAGDVLDAGSGLSSYLWNTGDSSQSIVINAEGMYSVEMESPVGCLGLDSVYVKLTSEEIPETHLFIPNAFTPDGDGVNDNFMALYNGNDISHFTMEVYDRWGVRIFRSENILLGWDGKKNGNPCPGGIYVYKIVLSVDEVTGNQERVGTVALVR